MGCRASRLGRPRPIHGINPFLNRQRCPPSREGKVETVEYEFEQLLPSSSVSEAAPTPAPPDTESRWWLQIAIGEFDIRTLYDSGASTTIMGTVGVQIVSFLERKFDVARSGQVRLADGQKRALFGHVLVPFAVIGIRENCGLPSYPSSTKTTIWG